MELNFRTLLLSEAHSELPEVTITGTRLVQDSRDVTDQSIFVAMGSSGASGHRYTSEAISRGAQQVLVDAVHFEETQALVQERERERIIAVPALYEHLGYISSAFWGDPSSQLTIVGITGTNGKTSVVQMLSQAWAQLGKKSASVGTLGAGIFGEKLTYTGLTTPPVTQMHEFLAQFLAQGVTHVGLELSSHALVQGRAQGVHFSQVAFTNLSHDHLDFHGTMEKYAQAKEKIFDLAGSPDVVLNIDDVVGKKWWEKYHSTRNILTVSSQQSPLAQLSAVDVVVGRDGMTFRLTEDNQSTQPVTTALMGRFNVDNALIVAGLLRSENEDLEKIGNIISKLDPVFGRMNTIHVSSDSPMVIVDYAHTPDALTQALQALQTYQFSRIITVFGCTGDRDVDKRPDMAKIAEELSDLVIVTDDDVHFEDGDLIVEQIRRGFAHPELVIELRERDKALRYAITEAQTTDVVFIAGKGHEEYLIVGDEKVPFSDTEVARELLELKASGKL